MSIKNELLKGIIVGLCLLCFCSCSNDGRMVKKFIGRQNAREFNAASKYIYPADHASLYFFDHEVLSRAPNLLLKIVEKQNITIDGQKGVVVKLECKNVSQFFINYMQNLNKIDRNNCIVDTIFIKETRNGKKITFSWTTIKGENLFLASIDKKSSLQELNIYLKGNNEEKTNDKVEQKIITKKVSPTKRRKDFDDDDVMYVVTESHVEKQQEPITQKMDDVEKRDGFTEIEKIDEMEAIENEKVKVTANQDAFTGDINNENGSENLKKENNAIPTNSFLVNKGNIIGKLIKGNNIVIDAYSEDPEWVQCFTIDHTCKIVKGYIKKDPAIVQNSLFFSLGIFEGLSLLIAVIILVVIAFPIIYIGSIVDALFDRGLQGIIICVALILGLIATIYMLLENILFELFLINLPF